MSPPRTPPGDPGHPHTAVFARAAVGIGRVGLDGRWLEVNDRLCEIVGRSRAALLACTFQQITHPDDLEGDLRLVDDLLRGTRDHYVLEKRYLHADGRPIPIRLSGSLVRDAAGAPAFFVAVVQEIAAQRAAEAEAQRLGQQLQALLENATDFIYIKDQGSRLLAASQSLARLAGVPSWRDLVGLHDRDLFPPDLARSYEDEERALLAGTIREVSRVVPLVVRDGQQRWVHNSKWPVIDTATGAAVGLVGISRDVTDQVDLERQLRATRDRLRIAGALSYDVSYVWDPGADRIEWHDGVDALLGLPAGTMGPRLADWAERLHPDDRGRALALLASHIHQPRPFSLEYRIRHADGSDRTWLERAEPVLDADGTPAHWVGVCTDVTEHRAAEATREATMARLRLARDVFDYASEGIAVTDASGTIIDVNGAFTEITGYTRAEATGENPRILKSGRHDPGFYEAMWGELLAKGEWTGEIWNRRKSGEVYPERLTISAVRDDAGDIQNYVALFADITRQKKFEADLHHTAQHDALTGLPNRLLLQDRLEQALHRATRRGRRVAVVYLDLDGFKGVNDRYGHATGDDLLVVLAAALQAAVRAQDTVARIGGDEFVAVITDLEPDSDAADELERLRLAAASPHSAGGHTLTLSASLGVSFHPQDPPIDADGLLRQADQAMYTAKQSGRDRVQVFEHAANRRLQDRKRLLDDLGDAIATDALTLHYQPKVHMRTGGVVGVEALVRWQHPTRGPLPPDLFVPLAEGTPRCIELGEWVIARALRDAQAWRDAGLDLTVSVNISPHHLQHPAFVDRLAALLAEAPGPLELEIVESSQVQDLASAAEILRGCRELGVTLSIDDFGTGYASLTWVRRLPVDLLKIDRSFVADMLDDQDDRAILEAAIGLARAFSLDVIAEGVESEAIGLALLSMGCALAQGYAIARPMPAGELPGWTAGWCPPASWNTAPAG